MADDERRAEIEAVADALSWADTPDPAGRVDPNNYTGLAVAAIRALDAVRDARGDDAVQRAARALVESWWEFDSLPPQDQYNAVAERVEVLADALDRVRDARGDDEPVWVSPLAEAEHDEAARSPQGEDSTAENLRRKGFHEAAAEVEDRKRTFFAPHSGHDVEAARSPQGEDHEGERDG